MGQRDRRYHLTGGFGTACAAIEALSRSLRVSWVRRGSASPACDPMPSRRLGQGLRAAGVARAPTHAGRGGPRSDLDAVRPGQRDDRNHREPDLRLDHGLNLVDAEDCRQRDARR